MTDPTRDDLLAEILAAIQPDRPEGEGWMSTTEFIERSGMSPSVARRRLADAEQAGKLERWPGGGNGKMNYWRVKNG